MRILHQNIWRLKDAVKITENMYEIIQTGLIQKEKSWIQHKQGNYSQLMMLSSLITELKAGITTLKSLIQITETTLKQKKQYKANPITSKNSEE